MKIRIECEYNRGSFLIITPETLEEKQLLMKIWGRPPIIEPSRNKGVLEMRISPAVELVEGKAV